MRPGAAARAPLSELYREHRQKALAIARRILGDSDEAEDVVQEVFSRLCSQPGHFEGRAAYSTWLHRVMVNSSINSLRAKRRRGQLVEAPRTSPDPEAHAMSRELEAKLDAVLERLSAQHRQVVFLRDRRGYSYPEIAALLRIPEGTVKSALNRGRAKLLKLLAEKDGQAP